MFSNARVTSKRGLQEDRKRPFDAIAYFHGLLVDHHYVSELGLTSSTLETWKAGYATHGINRGRLAVPVFDDDGYCAGYFGIPLEKNSPLGSFPHGLLVSRYIFGCEKLLGGKLYLARSPVDVMRAYQRGRPNVVSFLTDTILPDQIDRLGTLIERRACDSVELL